MLKEQTYTEERCTIIQEFQKAGNDADENMSENIHGMSLISETAERLWKLSWHGKGN